MPSKETEQPTPYCLKDTDPTVVMDIKLGKLGKHIDFDYDNFRTMANGMGGDDDNSNVTISLEKSSKFTYGSYNKKNHHIALKTGIHSEKTQKTLQHEYAHHLSHIYNSYPKYVDIQNKIGMAALRTLPILTAELTVLAGVLVAEKDSSAPFIDALRELYSTNFPTEIILTLGALAIGGYRFNKEERDARKAGKHPLPQAFIFTDR